MRLKCIKDFIMEDGDRAFTKGNTYDFYKDNEEYLTDNDDDYQQHWMDDESMFEYFTKEAKMTTKYMLVSEDMRNRFLNKGKEWAKEEHFSQHATENVAAQIVAEYLANRGGFTLFEDKATYGLSDD